MECKNSFPHYSKFPIRIQTYAFNINIYRIIILHMTFLCMWYHFNILLPVIRYHSLHSEIINNARINVAVLGRPEGVKMIVEACSRRETRKNKKKQGVIGVYLSFISHFLSFHEFFRVRVLNFLGDFRIPYNNKDSYFWGTFVRNKPESLNRQGISLLRTSTRILTVFQHTLSKQTNQTSTQEWHRFDRGSSFCLWATISR